MDVQQGEQPGDAGQRAGLAQTGVEVFEELHHGGVLSGGGEVDGEGGTFLEPGQPAGAEHGKVVEAAVVLLVRATQRADQAGAVGTFCGEGRHGADDAVDCHANGSLELAGGCAGSGVDPEVEHRQGDADRQQVAAHGVSVERLVDRIGFGNGQVADVVRRDGAAAPVGEGPIDGPPAAASLSPTTC